MNHVYTDHENRLYSWISGDQYGADGDQRWKRRAGAAHVKSAGVLSAKFMLWDHRGVGRDIVGRCRAEKDQVDVFRFAACAFERLFGCRQGKVRRHPVVRDIETLG